MHCKFLGCNPCNRTKINDTGECPNQPSATPAGHEKYCPDCGHSATFEATPEFNSISPWEVYCEACGWFHKNRFTSIEEAVDAMNNL
jgi:hypothetical protein